MITFFLLSAAAALILWPKFGTVPAPIPALPQPQPAAPKPQRAPTYHEALLALSTVRGRLLATSSEGVDTESAKAIDTLTLSLVHGSDQP
jgi:hypothetical protein